MVTQVGGRRFDATIQLFNHSTTLKVAIKLTIDGRTVEVEQGQTVLDAARQLGIDIPTLCYLEKCGPLTSCLACVVKLKASNGADKVVPSCATVAQPGMVIESETDEVREARRTALELLLSDHVGDCLSPCHRLCPLDLNIPEVLRHIQAGETDHAMAIMEKVLPTPSIISRLCHAPCENGCRRGTVDQAVAIREVERLVADEILRRDARKPVASSDQASHSEIPPAANRKSVVIVGAGPTGLAAAFSLIRQGHACTVVDRNKEPGGSLRTVDANMLPGNVLPAEIKRLEQAGVDFKRSLQVGQTFTVEGLLRGFDAVLLTPGALQKEEIASFGVAAMATGIKIDPDTFQTNVENVFAAGSAVKPIKQIVRAMSDGIAAAECIHQFLADGAIRKSGKTFSSIMGRLDKDEVMLFMKHASDAPRSAPAKDQVEFTLEQASAEAARCVHCDCRAAGDCKLQHYSAVYGADPGRFRDQRRRFEQNLQHAGVIYEPGKCIRCGICVRITELAREPLGLTYIGRGFDVQIAAPLNASMAQGLKQTAADCIEGCPTGALVDSGHDVKES